MHCCPLIKKKEKEKSIFWANDAVKKTEKNKRPFKSMVPSLSVSNRITIKPIMAMSGSSLNALQQLSNSRFEVARLFLNLARRYSLQSEILFFLVRISFCSKMKTAFILLNTCHYHNTNIPQVLLSKYVYILYSLLCGCW